MNNMRKSLCVLTAVAAVLAFAGQSAAFCVHNYTDRDMAFSQSSGEVLGKGYRNTLSPGETGCCNWGNKDCNKKGHKDSAVGFTVSHGTYPTGRDVCINKKIPACSDLDVTGSKGIYQCVPHGMETCN